MSDPGSRFTRKELFRRLREALRAAGDVPYAIGGATAMAAHGYRRSTRDIDVFVLEGALNPVMRALRGAGLESFAISEPSHYAAKMPGDPDPERRIDVLVPAGEPEISAVEYPVEWRGLRVFAPALLAMAKFYAFDDGGDPKHALDLLAMYRRGIFDPEAVRRMVQAVDPERVTPWDSLIQSFQTSRRGTRAPRPTRRIPPPT